MSKHKYVCMGMPHIVQCRFVFFLSINLLFITTCFGQVLVGLTLELLRLQCVYAQKKKVTEQQYKWHHMLTHSWRALAAK